MGLDLMLEKLRRARHAAVNFRKRFSPTGVVLMYHRVAPFAIDPWDLNVEPEHFDQQLGIIKKHTQPMHLADLADAYAAGQRPDRFCVLTFDDGYFNNLQFAKPLLDQHDIPATVFVSTGYTGRQREFWWEELDDLLLSPMTLPQRLELALGNQTHAWDLGLAADAYHDPTHRQPDPVREARLSLYFKVWEPMQVLGEDQRFIALDTIRQWSGWDGKPRETHRAMTHDELNQIVEGHTVQLGGHTVRHPYLPGLPVDQQRKEILEGKAELEGFVDRTVNTFSYPFNSHTPDTVDIARAAGFKAACTGGEESVWHNTDRHQLARFAVENWDGPAFERRLLQWLS